MKKQKATNTLLIIVSLSIYIANYFFKKELISYNFPFIRNHLNDLLAAIVVMSYSGILLNFQNRNSIISPALTFGICSFCGIIWEYVAPFLNPTSVSDYIDILCYYCSGFIYCSIINIFVKEV